MKKLFSSVVKLLRTKYKMHGLTDDQTFCSAQTRNCIFKPTKGGLSTPFKFPHLRQYAETNK